MARTNWEDEDELDGRLEPLAKILGNRDAARGMLMRFWRMAQDKWAEALRSPIPREEFDQTDFEPLLRTGWARMTDGANYEKFEVETGFQVSRAVGIIAGSLEESEDRFGWYWQCCEKSRRIAARRRQRRAEELARISPPGVHLDSARISPPGVHLDSARISPPGVQVDTSGTPPGVHLDTSGLPGRISPTLAPTPTPTLTLSPLTPLNQTGAEQVAPAVPSARELDRLADDAEVDTLRVAADLMGRSGWSADKETGKWRYDQACDQLAPLALTLIELCFGRWSIFENRFREANMGRHVELFEKNLRASFRAKLAELARSNARSLQKLLRPRDGPGSQIPAQAPDETCDNAT